MDSRYGVPPADPNAPQRAPYQPGQTNYQPGNTNYNPPNAQPYQTPAQNNAAAPVYTRPDPAYRPGSTSDYSPSGAVRAGGTAATTGTPNVSQAGYSSPSGN